MILFEKFFPCVGLHNPYTPLSNFALGNQNSNTGSASGGFCVRACTLSCVLFPRIHKQKNGVQSLDTLHFLNICEN